MSKKLVIKTPITNATEDYLLNLPNKASGEYTVATTDIVQEFAGNLLNMEDGDSSNASAPTIISSKWTVEIFDNIYDLLVSGPTGFKASLDTGSNLYLSTTIQRGTRTIAGVTYNSLETGIEGPGYYIYKAGDACYAVSMASGDLLVSIVGTDTNIVSSLLSYDYTKTAPSISSMDPTVETMGTKYFIGKTGNETASGTKTFLNEVNANSGINFVYNNQVLHLDSEAENTLVLKYNPYWYTNYQVLDGTIDYININPMVSSYLRLPYGKGSKSGSTITRETLLTTSDLNNYVTGPSSSTDSDIVVFDGITGKAIKSSGWVANSSGLQYQSTGLDVGTNPFGNIGANKSITLKTVDSAYVYISRTDAINSMDYAFYADAGKADLGYKTSTVDRRWRNLYLSGNLTDGTNSIAIANIAKDDMVVHKGDIDHPSDEDIYGIKTFKSGELTIGSDTNTKMKISSHTGSSSTLVVSCTAESIGAPARLQLGTGSNSGVGILTLSNYTSPTQSHPNSDTASIQFVKGTGTSKKEAFLIVPNVGTPSDPKTLAILDDIPTNLKNGGATGSAKVIDDSSLTDNTFVGITEDNTYTTAHTANYTPGIGSSGAYALEVGGNCYINGKRGLTAGTKCVVTASGGVAIGDTTLAKNYAMAQGYKSIAKNTYSHAEGSYTIASGEYSHSEGFDTHAESNGSHTEGKETYATAIIAHAEGYKTKASGSHSHSEGYDTKAAAESAHSEGHNTYAGIYVAPSGGGSGSGGSDPDPGSGTPSTVVALAGFAAHAEGVATAAYGNYSHAEGYMTKTEGDGAHAEGIETRAIGQGSHTGGYQTVANHSNQTVFGIYNDNKNSTLFEVGCGSSTTPKNGLEVYYDGRAAVGEDPRDPMDIATKQYVDNKPSAPTKYKHNIILYSTNNFAMSFSFINGTQGAYTAVSDLLAALNSLGYTDTTHMLAANGTVSSTSGLLLILGVYRNSASYLGYRHVTLATISNSGATVTINNKTVTNTSSVDVSGGTINDTVEEC